MKTNTLDVNEMLNDKATYWITGDCYTYDGVEKSNKEKRH